MFVCIDSLRHINNLSVIKGLVFLGCPNTKLGIMCLAQGPQRSDAGEARTRGPLVSSQALYHWATVLPNLQEMYKIWNLCKFAQVSYFKHFMWLYIFKWLYLLSSVVPFVLIGDLLMNSAAFPELRPNAVAMTELRGRILATNEWLWQNLYLQKSSQILSFHR